MGVMLLFLLVSSHAIDVVDNIQFTTSLMNKVGAMGIDWKTGQMDFDAGWLKADSSTDISSNSADEVYSKVLIALITIVAAGYILFPMFEYVASKISEGTKGKMKWRNDYGLVVLGGARGEIDDVKEDIGRELVKIRPEGKKIPVVIAGDMLGDGWVSFDEQILDDNKFEVRKRLIGRSELRHLYRTYLTNEHLQTMLRRCKMDTGTSAVSLYVMMRLWYSAIWPRDTVKVLSEEHDKGFEALRSYQEFEKAAELASNGYLSKVANCLEFAEKACSLPKTGSNEIRTEGLVYSEFEKIYAMGSLHRTYEGVFHDKTLAVIGNGLIDYDIFVKHVVENNEQMDVFGQQVYNPYHWLGGFLSSESVNSQINDGISGILNAAREKPSEMSIFKETRTSETLAVVKLFQEEIKQILAAVKEVTSKDDDTNFSEEKQGCISNGANAALLEAMQLIFTKLPLLTKDKKIVRLRSMKAYAQMAFPGNENKLNPVCRMIVSRLDTPVFDKNDMFDLSKETPVRTGLIGHRHPMKLSFTNNHGRKFYLKIARSIALGDDLVRATPVKPVANVPYREHVCDLFRSGKDAILLTDDGNAAGPLFIRFDAAHVQRVCGTSSGNSFLVGFLDMFFKEKYDPSIALRTDWVYYQHADGDQPAKYAYKISVGGTHAIIVEEVKREENGRTLVKCGDKYVDVTDREATAATKESLVECSCLTTFACDVAFIVSSNQDQFKGKKLAYVVDNSMNENMVLIDDAQILKKPQPITPVQPQSKPLVVPDGGKSVPTAPQTAPLLSNAESCSATCAAHKDEAVKFTYGDPLIEKNWYQKRCVECVHAIISKSKADFSFFDTVLNECHVGVFGLSKTFLTTTCKLDGTDLCNPQKNFECAKKSPDWDAWVKEKAKSCGADCFWTDSKRRCNTLCGGGTKVAAPELFEKDDTFFKTFKKKDCALCVAEMISNKNENFAIDDSDCRHESGSGSRLPCCRVGLFGIPLAKFAECKAPTAQDLCIAEKNINCAIELGSAAWQSIVDGACRTQCA